MKITCQSCQSKYNVADEKVQGKIVKIRCRKCGATIVVNGTGGDAAANGAAAAAENGAVTAASGDVQWHVNVSDTDQRTMSLPELVDAYNAGVVTQEMFSYKFEGENADGTIRGTFESSGLRPVFMPKAEYHGLSRLLMEAVG